MAKLADSVNRMLGNSLTCGLSQVSPFGLRGFEALFGPGTPPRPPVLSIALWKQHLDTVRPVALLLIHNFIDLRIKGMYVHTNRKRPSSETAWFLTPLGQSKIPQIISYAGFVCRHPWTNQGQDRYTFMLFKEFRFSEPLLESIGRQGYKSPTKIQELAIPHVLAGKDVMGCAQTGTGKTAAFALPILQRMSLSEKRRGKRIIRVLAIAPTRELASQIGQNFNDFGQRLGFRATVIYGGVGQARQTNALTAGVDILAATPGRLLDLMNQGFVDLSCVDVLVLDEADRMLDMGFIHDIRRIVKAIPQKRQTLLFSATMPHTILQMAKGLLDNPVSVNVTPPATTVELIDQSVYFVERPEKIGLLVHLLGDRSINRVLVFTKTKRGADNVVRKLDRASIPAAAIHGNKSQNNRERALGDFKSGKSRVLVATDIASRGLDIDQVTHVVNYDLPNEPESYVHRIGRTGRAGASGIAFSFCGHEERPLLTSIERLIRQRLDVQQKPKISFARPQPPLQEQPRPNIPTIARPYRPARRRSNW